VQPSGSAASRGEEGGLGAALFQPGHVRLRARDREFVHVARLGDATHLERRLLQDGSGGGDPFLGDGDDRVSPLHAVVVRDDRLAAHFEVAELRAELVEHRVAVGACLADLVDGLGDRDADAILGRCAGHRSA
jgi:hypothetical protein